MLKGPMRLSKQQTARPLRWGICGAGKISTDFAIGLFQNGFLLWLKIKNYHILSHIIIVMSNRYHETMLCDVVCAFVLEVWIDWSTHWVGVPGSVQVYLKRSLWTWDTEIDAIDVCFSDLNAGFQDRAEDLSLSFQPFRFMSRVNTWQIQSLFNHGMGNWKTWKWSQPEVLMFMPWPLGLAVRNLSRSLQPLVTKLATASCFRKRGHIWSLINLHIINLMLSNVVKDRRTEVTCILQLWIDRDPFASGLSLCLI